MPGAFKLDHLQPLEPILSQNIMNFFTFILGGQFLLPQTHCLRPFLLILKVPRAAVYSMRSCMFRVCDEMTGGKEARTDAGVVQPVMSFLLNVLHFHFLASVYSVLITMMSESTIE